MKLNEIREIVAFMKEEGVCELEYTERSTSIRLKLTPPAPPKPWDRFRAAAPETPETAQAPEAAPEAEPLEEPSNVLDMELGEAAEKVCQGAVKAGGKVVERVKAGASYLKSRRDELLAGNTPGAYDVELVEEDEAHASEPSEAAPEETPVVGEVPEYVPQEEAGESAPAEEVSSEEAPVKLDLEAAKTAVSRTAEVVANAALAAVELGAAGVRRGSGLFSDLLHRSDALAAEVTASAEDAAPAAEAEDPDAQVCDACDAPVEPGTCETCEAAPEDEAEKKTEE